MNLKAFLMPNKPKILALLFFLVVYYLGNVVGWAFCKECAPKPFIYDFIPQQTAGSFWLLSVLITAPVYLPISILSKIAADNGYYGIGFGELSLPLIIIYFYLLSCFIGDSFKKFGKKFTTKVIGAWAALFLALKIFEFFIQNWIFNQLGEQTIISATRLPITFMLANIATEAIAFALFAFIITSLYFTAKEKLKMNQKALR